LNLLHIKEFEISTPHCPIHYSPTRNGDVLIIVVHNNVWPSETIVSDILDSDRLPIVWHFLDHIRTWKLSDPVDKFTDCEQFRSLASELMSPRIQTNLGVEADKAVTLLLL
jgi:hypothetical protein